MVGGIIVPRFFDNLQKFAIFLVVTLLIVSFLFPSMYMGTFRLINNVDSSIYARYATNGKFEENLFFSTEIEKNTGIIEQLESKIVTRS